MNLKEMTIEDINILQDKLSDEAVRRKMKADNIESYSKTTTQGLINIQAHFNKELLTHTDEELIKICDEHIVYISNELSKRK